ncbi:MAG: polysaccharide biosynthesis/export family protein [Planctomycetes bacterium]|nr:polysaccharide biosynthesis/export family protein [Planctomycetota bacterium]
MAMLRSLMQFSVISWVLLVCAGGCSRTDHWIPDSPPAQPSEFYQPASLQTAIPEQLVEYRAFRLSPGDVVEIIYSVRNEISDEPYQLKIEDRVRLVFPYQKQFDQEVTVGGDGNIRCLLIGGIRAAGYTASDLELQLKERYKAHLKEPELTVLVGAANVKIDELKKAITTAPRGQSRLVPIKPDGTIDLPYVGECFIAGKTVQESKEFLDKKYMEVDLPEVAVTVQSLEFAPKHIFVGGEVNSPGMISAPAPVTLVQALFQLGGTNSRADARNILLVRRKYQPIPEAILFDLESVLTPSKRAGAKFRQDIFLEDGDIIYVPPTELAKSNDWIDQVFTRGIRAVMPYSAEIGLDFGYQIRQAPISIHR